MTLSEILPAVLQLPSPDKLKLIRILAENLDAAQDIRPFERGKSYELSTPYHIVGAAKVLADELAATDKPSN